MEDYNGVLGMLEANGDVVLIEEHIEEVCYSFFNPTSPFIKPDNIKRLEQKYPQKNFIWGGETADRLFEIWEHAETNQRKKDFVVLVFATHLGERKNVFVMFLRKIQKADEVFYRGLPTELLASLGLSKYSREVSGRKVSIGFMLGRGLRNILKIFK
jgi:hypothetical protein